MKPAFSLEGKNAVITGASRGIGQAIALAYARQGARVALVARSRERLEAVAREVEGQGAPACVLPADVTDAEAMEEALAEAERALGPVDLLVNNAGAFKSAPFLEHELADWERLLQVNVMGVVIGTRAALRRMLPRGRGRIITVASTAGKYGSLNQAAYNASKHAVVGLTRSLALEVAGRGVRVNAICPNLVQTDMFTDHQADYLRNLGLDDPSQVLERIVARIPIGRTVTPEEVAALAVYLAADESDAMTGMAVTLSGGFLLI